MYIDSQFLTQGKTIDAPKVAQETLDYFREYGGWWDCNITECSTDHVVFLLEEVIEGRVIGEEASRHIAWSQCLITGFNNVPVDVWNDIVRKHLLTFNN